MKNAYIVMADTDYDGSTPIRVFETKGGAVAFRDRCVLHESNRPEYPSIIEDTPENDAAHTAAYAALARWRKRHPGGEVAGYRNLFSVLALPFVRRDRCTEGNTMTLDKERLRVLASDFRSHPLSQHIAEVEEAGEGISALLSENAALEERERHALMAADAEAKLFDEERQKNAALAAEVERLRADIALHEWQRAQLWHKSNLL